MEIIFPLSSARCVIVVDEALPVGQLANAAAVIALTIGKRHSNFVGEPLIDASGLSHPGLIPIGITVLSASQNELSQTRLKGIEAGCDIVDFPLEGQQTKNYQEFREAIAGIETNYLRYAGVALIGDKKEIRKITNHLNLLR
jgi:hypothetical protein